MCRATYAPFSKRIYFIDIIYNVYVFRSLFFRTRHPGARCRQRLANAPPNRPMRNNPAEGTFVRKEDKGKSDGTAKIISRFNRLARFRDFSGLIDNSSEPGAGTRYDEPSFALCNFRRTRDRSSSQASLKGSKERKRKGGKRKCSSPIVCMCLF